MGACRVWGIGAGLVSVLVLGAACSGSNALSPYQRITVSVTGAGEGHGYVSANTPDVDVECGVGMQITGSSCEDTFSDAGQGGVFSLIAYPSEGSVFAGWSWSTGEVGCTAVNGNACEIHFSETDDDVHFRVTARFELVSAGLH